MLNFIQKEDKKEQKTFNNIQIGDYFVWADNPDHLMLKITRDCYFAIDNNFAYTTCDFISHNALGYLDINRSLDHTESSLVFKIEFEDYAVKWKVIK